MHPGISDREIIEIAQKEKLIILTFDKDYGEIIFKHQVSQPPAVVFFRFKGDNPLAAGTLLSELIDEKKLMLENTFTVIEHENIRQRKY